MLAYFPPSFQSAPRSELRGDLHPGDEDSEFIRFNPRPGASSGATCSHSQVDSRPRVSIRAPERAPGRPHQTAPLRSIKKFQSAPRSELRGDLRYATKRSWAGTVSIRAPERAPGRLILVGCWVMYNKFQSAPRSGLRGDSIALYTAAPITEFQSAPRSELRGDPRPLEAPALATPFQSAPRSELRGDLRAINTVTGLACFNPRPGANSGATASINEVDPAWPVSIRAPERAPGRPPRSGRKHLGNDVSIRAPERAPGRPVLIPQSLDLISFQSAPRSELRGDPRCAPLVKPKTLFQSAPRSDLRGDSFCCRFNASAAMFQSAPRSELRGDSCGCCVL